MPMLCRSELCMPIWLWPSSMVWGCEVRFVCLCQGYTVLNCKVWSVCARSILCWTVKSDLFVLGLYCVGLWSQIYLCQGNTVLDCEVRSVCARAILSWAVKSDLFVPGLYCVELWSQICLSVPRLYCVELWSQICLCQGYTVLDCEVRFVCARAILCWTVRSDLFVPGLHCVELWSQICLSAPGLHCVEL